MTPLRRTIRDAWEKLTGRFYEGPQPPERLRLLVVEWLNAHPYPLKRREVFAFCDRLIRVTWEAAYVRGWEHTIRDEQATWRKHPPELVADYEDPDWRWRPMLGEELAEPEQFVEDESPAPVIELAGHATNKPPEDDDR